PASRNTSFRHSSFLKKFLIDFIRRNKESGRHSPCVQVSEAGRDQLLGEGAGDERDLGEAGHGRWSQDGHRGGMCGMDGTHGLEVK
ncbi:hypothetical protein AVEN_11494-1, partial [Araneus ventricosus]